MSNVRGKKKLKFVNLISQYCDIVYEEWSWYAWWGYIINSRIQSNCVAAAYIIFTLKQSANGFERRKKKHSWHVLYNRILLNRFFNSFALTFFNYSILRWIILFTFTIMFALCFFISWLLSCIYLCMYIIFNVMPYLSIQKKFSVKLFSSLISPP